MGLSWWAACRKLHASLPPGALHAPAASHSSYSATVVSVKSMSKAASQTSCWGLSSSLHSSSTAGLHPIQKGPAGTRTICI